MPSQPFSARPLSLRLPVRGILGIGYLSLVTRGFRRPTPMLDLAD